MGKYILFQQLPKLKDTILGAHIVQNIEPWLCRSLGKLGANIVGVDLYASKEQDWVAVKCDLTQEKSLVGNLFTNASRDVVVTTSFLGNRGKLDAIEFHTLHNNPMEYEAAYAL